MKKLILGIALFGGLSAANAQIDLGVKGGLNLTSLLYQILKAQNLELTFILVDMQTIK